MSAHWKIGDGFAIRYGGYRDIQWFFGDGFQATPSLLPPLHPAAACIEVAKAAALFLQWWEMRKQTAIMQAAHEERRIPWLVDMIAQLQAEIRDEHTLRADTLLYLERELTRLLGKLQSLRDMDTPSSLLLHVERQALALAQMNRVLIDALAREQPNFILPGRDGILEPFHYRPFYEIMRAPEQARDRYFASAASVASELGGVAGALPLAIFAPAVAVVWTAGKLLSAWRAAEKEKRLEEFTPLVSLMIEVRSTRAIVAMLGAATATLVAYDAEGNRQAA
jgi:hypothetical protein